MTSAFPQEIFNQIAGVDLGSVKTVEQLHKILYFWSAERDIGNDSAASGYAVGLDLFSAFGSYARWNDLPHVGHLRF